MAGSKGKTTIISTVSDVSAFCEGVVLAGNRIAPGLLVGSRIEECVKNAMMERGLKHTEPRAKKRKMSGKK